MSPDSIHENPRGPTALGVFRTLPRTAPSSRPALPSTRSRAPGQSAMRRPLFVLFAPWRRPPRPAGMALDFIRKSIHNSGSPAQGRAVGGFPGGHPRDRVWIPQPSRWGTAMKAGSVARTPQRETEGMPSRDHSRRCCALLLLILSPLPPKSRPRGRPSPTPTRRPRQRSSSMRSMAMNARR